LTDFINIELLLLSIPIWPYGKTHFNLGVQIARAEPNFPEHIIHGTSVVIFETGVAYRWLSLQSSLWIVEPVSTSTIGVFRGA